MEAGSTTGSKAALDAALSQPYRCKTGPWALVRKLRARDCRGCAEPVCMALNDIAGDSGLVGLLAVRRRWRQHGLGMALLCHAAGASHRRGLTRYTLGVDSESQTGATRLYERAGMHIAQTYDGYLRERRLAAELAELDGKK